MAAGMRQSVSQPQAWPREVLRGVGEVAAFFAACASAVIDLCIGRWPKARSVKASATSDGAPGERVAASRGDD